MELRPDYYGLYFTRGVTYFLSQQFGRAVEDFNRFIIHEPRDPGAWLNRGASYLFLGDTAKALRDYNQAIELDFREPEGYIRRSRIYYAQHSPPNVTMRSGAATFNMSRAAAVWAAMMSRSITPSVTVRSHGSKLTGTV